MKTNLHSTTLWSSALLLLVFSASKNEAARIIQSSVCSPEEHQSRIQCLEVLPEEKYYASLGDTVNMRCVVANQHGKVQWRAKRILLGYDRSIPAYTRLRVIGDVSRGEHTLQIMDIKLEDAGEYECQVTPVPKNNHPLLRRRTELVVLVRPSEPRILYPDVPPPDNQLIISQPDPLIQITVLCVSSGGSPPPTFTWFLNNLEVPTHSEPQQMPAKASEPLKKAEAKQVCSTPVCQTWTKLAPIVETQTELQQSRLSLFKAGLSDGDQLVCSVTNPASQMHHDVHRRNLTTRVTVRIHTPPGPPQIVSPKSNVMFSEGEELRAVCVASPPGNPLGGLFWRWLLQPSHVGEATAGKYLGLGGKGGIRLTDYNSVEFYHHHFVHDWVLDSGGSGGTLSASSDGGLISEDVQPLHYRLNKEKHELTNTLVIPKISRRYHAAKLVCETGHPVGNSQQTSITVYVKYAPTNVTLSLEGGGELREERLGTHQELVVYGRAGEKMTLVCRTGPYFNQATIKWVAQAPNSQSLSGLPRPPRPLYGQPKTMRTPDGESFVQESRVEFTIEEKDDHGYIDCRVWGEDHTPRIDARVRLDIVYPPEVPTILGYENHQPVKMSHPVELTCLTRGGNPLPELKWYKDNKLITSTGELTVNGRQSSLSLRVVPQREDNGAHYHCTTANTATGKAGIRSDPIVLNVLFPPERLTISFFSLPVVSSGQQLVLDCLAGTSNPVALITWWHFRCGPAHAFAHREQAIAKQKQQQQQPIGAPGTVGEGDTGKDSVKCKSVQLEGADERPSPGEFGGLQAHSRLWLHPTWHYHMDYVECRTENPEYGQPVWRDRLQLNITFPPQFLGLQSNTKKVVQEDQSTRLDLGIYANPPITAVTWSLGGRQLPREVDPATKKTPPPGVYVAGPIGELLAVHKVSRRHMANYTVTAVNSIAESKETFFLNVTYPASLLGKAIENVTFTGGLSAELTCSAEGNPAAADRSFTWLRYLPPKSWPQDGHEATWQLSGPMLCSLPFNESSKYEVSCRQDSALQMSSSLTIKEVTADDTGTYLCDVSNGLGRAVRKEINFFYPFAPSIIRLPRYTRAAGEQSSVVTLTCYVRTEPWPQIAWLKADGDGVDGTLLLSVAPGQQDRRSAVATGGPMVGGRLRAETLPIRPGLYKAVLTFSNLQKSDFGKYKCQAINALGEEELIIMVSGTSTPDVPVDVRLLNATYDSLLVGWTQGFDGGLQQTFQIRWRQATPNSMYMYADVVANDNKNSVHYSVTGLREASEYIISVKAMNSKHGSSAYSDPIHVRTKSFDQALTSQLVPPLSGAGSSDDNALLIILAACVFGVIVFIVNTVVITFLVKRRRQRRRGRNQRLVQGGGKLGAGDTLLMTNGMTVSPTDQLMGASGWVDVKNLPMDMPDKRDAGEGSLASGSSSVGVCGCCPTERVAGKPPKSTYIKADPYGTYAPRDQGTMHQNGLPASDDLSASFPTQAFLSTNQQTAVEEQYPFSHQLSTVNTCQPHQLSMMMAGQPLSTSDLTGNNESLFTSRQHMPQATVTERQGGLSREGLYSPHTPRQFDTYSRHTGPLLTTTDRVRHHSTGLLLPSRCLCSNPDGRRLGAGGNHHGALSGQSPVRLLHVNPAGGTNTRCFYTQAAASRLGVGPSGSQERTVCVCDRCCLGYNNNNTSFYNNNSNQVDGDEEGDSDRTRYMEQLRRVQYGGGPTSELLLGTGSTSQHPMGTGRARATNSGNSAGQQLLHTAVSPRLLLSSPKLKRPNSNNSSSNSNSNSNSNKNRPVGGVPVVSSDTRVCALTSSVDSVKTSMHSSETSHVFPNCIV